MRSSTWRCAGSLLALICGVSAATAAPTTIDHQSAPLISRVMTSPKDVGLLRAIRHDDGLGAFDEDEDVVADEGHTCRAGEPVFYHSHSRAIAVDGQFGESSLPLGLDQRPWAHGPQAVGTA